MANFNVLSEVSFSVLDVDGLTGGFIVRTGDDALKVTFFLLTLPLIESYLTAKSLSSVNLVNINSLTEIVHLMWILLSVCFIVKKLWKDHLQNFSRLY